MEKLQTSENFFYSVSTKRIVLAYLFGFKIYGL